MEAFAVVVPLEATPCEWLGGGGIVRFRTSDTQDQRSGGSQDPIYMSGSFRMETTMPTDSVSSVPSVATNQREAPGPLKL